MPDSMYPTHPAMFFIRPARGIRLADPKTGDYLPDSGALMPRSGFWLRRLKEGDVVEGGQPEKTGAVSTKTVPLEIKTESPDTKDGAGGGKTKSAKKTEQASH